MIFLLFYLYKFYLHKDKKASEFIRKAKNARPAPRRRKRNFLLHRRHDPHRVGRSNWPSVNATSCRTTGTRTSMYFGETDKRALFALAGGFEVAEELAFGARQCPNSPKIYTFITT
ncbi:hypothetical protein CD29_00885 [Ureibacillus manganicus DSM 26584]|uniref:Uncharacterized protein n=1 Tax=Ureibacillus manganicus DSM 26584 TaxID=1384049 RepID=A0A0A3I6Y6_9BACL|nr:hypothetical protein CD29_00885 [Ureibacillus manganicus DSM 26584]